MEYYKYLKTIMQQPHFLFRQTDNTSENVFIKSIEKQVQHFSPTDQHFFN